MALLRGPLRAVRPSTTRAFPALFHSHGPKTAGHVERHVAPPRSQPTYQFALAISSTRPLPGHVLRRCNETFAGVRNRLLHRADVVGHRVGLLDACRAHLAA